MFEDFDSRPYGICDTIYKVTKLLCLLAGYLATLIVIMMVMGLIA